MSLDVYVAPDPDDEEVQEWIEDDEEDRVTTLLLHPTTPLSIPLILTSDQEIRKNNVYFFLFTTYGSTGCSTNEKFSDARALFLQGSRGREFAIARALQTGQETWGSGRAQNKYRDCIFSMQ
jgi:hypothetical protein